MNEPSDCNVIVQPPVIAGGLPSVTAVLLVFCKVAVNCCVPPVVTLAEVGEIETATGGGAIHANGIRSAIFRS